MGRGSWSQDKSPQHPWMADVQRNGSIVPGPGMYSTPPRKKAGGRISDARPMMSEDLNRAVASRQPGPLEYADLGLKLPQARTSLLRCRCFSSASSSSSSFFYFSVLFHFPFLHFHRQHTTPLAFFGISLSYHLRTAELSSQKYRAGA